MTEHIAELRLSLKTPYVHPLWWRRVQGCTLVVEVDAAGEVVVDGEALQFQGAALPPGTRVRVTCARWITCVSQDAWERDQERRRVEAAADERERTEREDRRRAEARAFDAGLGVPVQWQPGIKDVLSGLSEHSLGDGRKRTTVHHILLLEPLSCGRLSRNAGDFLCTSANGSAGKQWSGQPGDDRCVKVTCKQCLSLAKRWARAPE